MLCCHSLGVRWARSLTECPAVGRCCKVRREEEWHSDNCVTITCRWCPESSTSFPGRGDESWTSWWCRYVIVWYMLLYVTKNVYIVWQSFTE